ncbi:hypothetical protein EMPS_01155 [Entomortierella parvispora]|uniref:Uncharacterized protein n=1 Tax=Entomortierella parvispora TaxID=205924 RepID=A0A9P3H2G7_9FUNG|nr:hypothetical protein EMPS_01155 [Entomortierella parvispora]
MVLWVGGHGARLRLFSSKRMVLSGSLLMMVLFYYVALPEPGMGHLEDRTPSQADQQFRKASKGSALADDTEIMMALPARERTIEAALPWFGSSDHGRASKDGEGSVQVGVGCLTDQEGTSCLVGSPVKKDSFKSKGSRVKKKTKKEGKLGVMSGAAAAEAEAKENRVLETDPKASHFSDKWTAGKELESIQEEEDEQGAEKEDGQEQEQLEELEAEEEAALEMAEERFEEAEEALEEAILGAEEQLREQDELLEEEQLERIVEGPDEEPLTEEELLNLTEDEEDEDEEEEDMEGEDIHRFVEGLFHDSAADMTEYEQEYREEDRLGQGGPSETMDDEE